MELSSGGTVGADRLILTTGVVDELPDIPGLAERWGVTVLHCPYCHGYEVADARLGVLATSETALHKAYLLPDWSRDVTLFTNGAFLPDSAQQAALEVRGIRLEPRPLDRLVGEGPGLAGAGLGDGALVELEALFVTSRTRMASPLAERLGCALEEGPMGPFVHTDTRKETSVPGVFCAGDAARAQHNATWAAADGATAGISAHQSIALAAAGMTAPSR